MAGVRKKGDAYYCTFRYQGRRHHFPLGKVPHAVANAKGVEVDEILDLLERGRLSVPEGVSLVDFVATGGNPVPVSAKSATVKLNELIDRPTAMVRSKQIRS